MGALGLVQGIRYRTGISRRSLAENYRDPRLPRWRRNGPFGLIPLSLVFLLVGVAAVEGGHVPPGLVAGLAAAALASGVAYLLIAMSPPAWSKPLWLREAEAAGWQGHRPEPRRGDVVVTMVLAIGTFGAIAVIIATSFQVGALVGPVLIGIGTALAFWRGRRRRGDS
jgi:hypothetical protein